MDKVDSLRDMVVESVPRALFERLIGRQPAIYAEASALAFKTPSWERPEAESVFPINRRALLESEFRRSARDLDLPYQDLKHKGDNYWYVLLHVGRLRITAHHVDRPRRFVTPCRSRRQNAAVNQTLDLPYFEDVLQEQPLSLQEVAR